ncbi:23S rRNA (adenine(2503)-C(2))-methyltransferase RlmN [Eubacteriales bacterium OttesenSCG-928-K08]|nr:23S rRNA (adenine(2503)-C(2))-methyltransferase RlmN [Eubacteriales bacterium OttesenSCG-928-K08]
MKNLMDMGLPELKALMAELNEPAYRAKQVLEWLNRGERPENMKNIPLALREKLAERPFGGAVIKRTFVSQLDGTLKFLFELEDGELVEGVLMRYKHGNTLCLSTQVGCRMGCVFCASTLEGRVRNIRCGEMLAMVVAAERTQNRPAHESRAITNIVLMGSGEPLDNFDEVVAFLWRVTSKEGLNISPRNISLSTCGLAPEIERLVNEAPHVTLCISLHAYNDAVRDNLLPINRKYPIRAVCEAADAYAKTTGRRVIFEYALIDGVNASQQDATALSLLLKGINCHVNLIPLNPVKERELAGVSRQDAARFASWLSDGGISATVRREMGADIEGACGQLRRRVLEEESGA